MSEGLRPGALMWHPETRRIGTVCQVEHQRGPVVASYGPAPVHPETFSIATFEPASDGWVPVGVDGTVPEGHRLAIISDGLDQHLRVIAAPPSFGNLIEEAAAEFVALNPEHGDTQ